MHFILRIILLFFSVDNLVMVVKENCQKRMLIVYFEMQKWTAARFGAGICVG